MIHGKISTSIKHSHPPLWWYECLESPRNTDQHTGTDDAHTPLHPSYGSRVDLAIVRAHKLVSGLSWVSIRRSNSGKIKRGRVVYVGMSCGRKCLRRLADCQRRCFVVQKDQSKARCGDRYHAALLTALDGADVNRAFKAAIYLIHISHCLQTTAKISICDRKRKVTRGTGDTPDQPMQYYTLMTRTDRRGTWQLHSVDFQSGCWASLVSRYFRMDRSHNWIMLPCWLHRSRK